MRWECNARDTGLQALGSVRSSMSMYDTAGASSGEPGGPPPEPGAPPPGEPGAPPPVESAFDELKDGADGAVVKGGKNLAAGAVGAIVLLVVVIIVASSGGSDAAAAASSASSAASSAATSNGSWLGSSVGGGPCQGKAALSQRPPEGDCQLRPYWPRPWR